MHTGHVADANENLRSSYALLATHGEAGAVRTFGSITAACVGVPVPVFNRVFVFGQPSRDDLEDAVDWMADREVPFRVTVPAPVVDPFEDLVSEGGPALPLVDSGVSEPGMVLAPLEELPVLDSDLEVETVTDDDGLGDFVVVASDAFDVPREVGEQLTPPTMLGDDRSQLFVGRTAGRPVACGLLVRTDDVAGVYTIGVAEGFRRRGFGATMTTAVLRAGRDRGCDAGVLQSSEMGYPVYERLGFETVVEYHHYALES